MSSGKTWDVIVVGGGLVGSSIAYQLAKKGVETLLVEQGELASGASGANFGNVQVQDADYGFSLELTIAGAKRCADIEVELDFDLDYQPAGSLLLIENEPQQAMMVERRQHLEAAGLQARLLGRDDLIQMEPFLNPETVIGGLYHPNEGQLNPFKLVHAYVLRGRQCGLDLATHTPVIGLTTQSGKITGVSTRTEHLSANYVVLTTGAWTRRLGRTVGLEIPAEWIRGEAIITEAISPSISNAMSRASFFEEADNPIETVVALALKQRPDGNVMLGEAITSMKKHNRDVAANSIAGMADEARRRLPRLKQTTILRSWGIPVAHTTDQRPLLGPVESIENLFVAAALKSTIVLTPIVGEVIAKMITGQAIDPRFADFSPSREIL